VAQEPWQLEEAGEVGKNETKKKKKKAKLMAKKKKKFNQICKGHNLQIRHIFY
jgi:hypothetical protein